MTLRVPSTFVRHCTSAVTALETTAAVWMTVEQPSAVACHAPGSPMSQATIPRPLSVARSKPRTSCPSPRRRSTSLPPMKPAAPVIRIGPSTRPNLCACWGHWSPYPSKNLSREFVNFATDIRPVDVAERAWIGASDHPRLSIMSAIETIDHPDFETIEPEEISLHGNRVSFLRAGDGPVAAPPARDRRQLRDLGAADPRPQRRVHRDRPRHARTRLLGQAARRLLARRLRGRCPRPPAGAGPRGRDHRRPLPRRRGRDAVRLPVPPAHGAPGPGLQRRAGRGGQPGPASGDAAGLGAGAAADHEGLGHRRRAPAGAHARLDRAAAGGRHQRVRARLRVARRSGGAPRVPQHGPLGDRSPRSARQRAGPALPGRVGALADRLGGARPDHPRRARAPRRARDAG